LAQLDLETDNEIMVDKMLKNNTEQISSKTEYLNSMDAELTSIQQPIRDTLSLLQNSDFSKSIAIKKLVIEDVPESTDKLLSYLGPVEQ